MLLSLWSIMEKLSELIHRGRKHHLIEWTGRWIENRYPDKLADDLEINSDYVSVNSGLQYRPMLIILSNLQVCIKESD
jgi:hypothetical protein